MFSKTGEREELEKGNRELWSLDLLLCLDLRCVRYRWDLVWIWALVSWELQMP